MPDESINICKRFYGDGQLAYQLATANGIQNPNLIYPGQVLTLPDAADLAGYAATAAPAAGAKGQSAAGDSAGAMAAARQEVSTALHLYAEDIALS